MGRTAEVRRVERATDAGGFGVDLVCDPGGGRSVTVPFYTTPGVDALPLPGDTVALEDTSGMGCEMGVGTGDTRNAGTAATGEVRLYARDAAGNVKAELWLKGDGSAVFANALGRIELGANGTVTINGVTIDPAGNIVTTGEVTAKAATPATAVNLSTHLHGTGVGPTTAPTPGT